MKKILMLIAAVLSSSMAAFAFVSNEQIETFEADGVLYAAYNGPGMNECAFVTSPEMEEDMLFWYSPWPSAKLQTDEAHPRDREVHTRIETKYYKGDVYIPDSVEYKGRKLKVAVIYTSAFCGCDSLTSVRLPSGLIEIGHYAFSGCQNLRELTIPKSVKTIGMYFLLGSGGQGGDDASECQ